MSANATPKQLAQLTDFGESLGLAFQVIDDILDVTQTTEKLGKSAGKDIAAQKATYPALLGLDKAKKEADRLTARARAALKPFGSNARPARGDSRIISCSARTRRQSGDLDRAAERSSMLRRFPLDFG